MTHLHTPQAGGLNPVSNLLTYNTTEPHARLIENHFCVHLGAMISDAWKANVVDALIELLALRLSERLALVLEQRNSGNTIRPRLLDIGSAAVYLGRTKKATQHLVAKGIVPVVRFGEEMKIMLDVRELDSLIDAGKI